MSTYNELPQEHELGTLPNGAKYFKIEELENLLDTFDSWGTQNFNYYLYRNSYANLCVAASLELWVEHDGKRRTFVGTNNFSIKSIYPIKHFLSTAKSECMKNAASDIGKRFGRGLNSDLEVVPNEDSEKQADEGITLHDDISNMKIKKNVTKV